MDGFILGSVLAALGTIATVTLAFSKLKKNFKEEIGEEIDAKIELAIQRAHSIAKSDLDLFKAKIEVLDKSIENMDQKFQREVEHIKETYNSEIRNLGGKIEELRSEVRHHHNQLIGLLSEMVKDKSS